MNMQIFKGKGNDRMLEKGEKRGPHFATPLTRGGHSPLHFFKLFDLCSFIHFCKIVIMLNRMQVPTKLLIDLFNP